jgi:hypothetical protein
MAWKKCYVYYVLTDKQIKQINTYELALFEIHLLCFENKNKANLFKKFEM